jgi:hypothetical protein
MKMPRVAIILGALLASFVHTLPAAELDAYGGFTDIVGKRTGFFHTQQIAGRWWLVTPEGHGFFGVGISHPVTGKSRAAVTFAYKGNQEAWMRDGIRKMRELGYNCVWSGPYPTRTWVRLAPYVDVLAPQDLSEANPVRAHIEATGKPALLSDQEFGNVYPLSIQDTPFTPGSVPEHVDRRVLYDLEATRIARDPGMIGVSFCACLFDQSHWISTYDRGQPGFYAIDGEPGEPDLLEVVTRVNGRIMESVHSPLDEASIDKIDRTFHETRDAYRTIMRMRMQLLQKTVGEN